MRLALPFFPCARLHAFPLPLLVSPSLPLLLLLQPPCSLSCFPPLTLLSPSLCIISPRRLHRFIFVIMAFLSTPNSPQVSTICPALTRAPSPPFPHSYDLACCYCATLLLPNWFSSCRTLFPSIRVFSDSTGPPISLFTL